MRLEHRWSPRTPVQAHAIIFHRPLGLLRGKVLNVSLDGALIDTGCITLPPHALVKLTLALDAGGKQRSYQMEAMVAHHGSNNRDRNHHGLMFKDFQLEDFRSAVRIMLGTAA